MTQPLITMFALNDGAADLPLLVVGPSLGSSVELLWGPVAHQLRHEFAVVGWELPGHGRSRQVADQAPTMEQLVQAVGEQIDAQLARRGKAAGGFYYAGDSAGGAVGIELAAQRGPQILGLLACCTAAYFGPASNWEERSQAVLSQGTAALVESSAQRWFAAGYAQAHPVEFAAQMQALEHTDDRGYAHACAALASYDARDKLAQITSPVIAVAGAEDIATPPQALHDLAQAIPGAWSVEVPGAAHLVPIERPDVVVQLLRGLASSARRRPAAAMSTTEDAAHPTAPAEPIDPDALEATATREQVQAAGFSVRRAVLGDAHVDRSQANITALSTDFQAFITQYAWGSIWTRPGLTRPQRSLITLTALVAGGHYEELRLHLVAAIANGLTPAQISETLLQTAVYVGVPAANTAFGVLKEVLAKHDQPAPPLTE